MWLHQDEICKKKSAGLVNNLIHNLPFEMHLPGYNKKRLKSDDTPKNWSKPINRVDKAAYHHDLYVTKKLQDNPTRNNVCDKTMLSDLKGIYNPSLRERFDRFIVNPIIKTKVNLKF